MAGRQAQIKKLKEIRTIRQTDVGFRGIAGKQSSDIAA